MAWKPDCWRDMPSLPQAISARGMSEIIERAEREMREEGAYRGLRIAARK